MEFPVREELSELEEADNRTAAGKGSPQTPKLPETRKMGRIAVSKAGPQRLDCSAVVNGQFPREIRQRESGFRPSNPAQSQAKLPNGARRPGFRAFAPRSREVPGNGLGSQVDGKYLVAFRPIGLRPGWLTLIHRWIGPVDACSPAVQMGRRLLASGADGWVNTYLIGPVNARQRCKRGLGPQSDPRPHAGEQSGPRQRAEARRRLHASVENGPVDARQRGGRPGRCTPAWGDGRRLPVCNAGVGVGAHERGETYASVE